MLGGEEGVVVVSFTQECRRTQQPGCVCSYQLMVQTQLVGSRAPEESILHFGSPPSARRFPLRCPSASRSRRLQVVTGGIGVEVQRTEENIGGSTVCERQFSTLVITRL